MPDPFVAALKEFEQVTTEIGQARERLKTLESRGEQLRKTLRSLGSGAMSDDATEVPGDRAISHAVQQVISALADLGGSASLADIAMYLSLPKKVVATRLQRAHSFNRVERESHGRYRLAPSEFAALLLRDSTSSN